MIKCGKHTWPAVLIGWISRQNSNAYPIPNSIISHMYGMYVMYEYVYIQIFTYHAWNFHLSISSATIWITLSWAIASGVHEYVCVTCGHRFNINSCEQRQGHVFGPCQSMILAKCQQFWWQSFPPLSLLYVRVCMWGMGDTRNHNLKCVAQTSHRTSYMHITYIIRMLRFCTPHHPANTPFQILVRSMTWGQKLSAFIRIVASKRTFRLPCHFH